mgnify:CR=1 FL=1
MSEMRKIDVVLYRIVRACWTFLSCFPFWFHYFMSDCLYLLVRYAVRYRLKIVKGNLESSFPERSKTQISKLVNDFYRWFCDYIAETVKYSSMSQKQLKRRMVFTGTDLIDKYVAEGRSCGVYLGHYGQWEWVTSLPLWIKSNGQCTQIYHPLENPVFDKLFKINREKNGALCVSMQETLRKTIEYQKKGQPIVMGYIADQVPNWFNIHHWIDFLNHDTPVFTGTERIMKKVNQVVFYASLTRKKRGYYQCDFQLLTDNAHDFEDFRITDMYFERLEASIRKDPSMYLWSHNRWKRTRAEFEMRYDRETGKFNMGRIEDVIQQYEQRNKRNNDNAAQ